MTIGLGAVLWSQSTDWDRFLAAAQEAEDLGFDHIWTWDHLLPIFGAEDQPILEGYAALAALAMATSRARIGLLVGANTFREPALVAKSVLTLDQVSHGRAIMGLGGAWFAREHEAFGFDFGDGFGQRLEWLSDAVDVIAALMAGETVDGAHGRYRYSDLRILPGPVQASVPVMIGGSGVRRTLPIVARHARMWNAFGEPGDLAEKDAILRDLCRAIDRDPAGIERTVGCKVTIRASLDEAVAARDALLANNRMTVGSIADDVSWWTGTPDDIIERMVAYAAIGFRTFLCELPAPYDVPTMRALTEVVRPAVLARVGA